jgi:Carboxypeptidase regulatory-like domain
MSTQAKLTGKVTVHGSAAHAATVELHNSSGDVVDQVVVDDDGRYTYHLSPGSWSLRLWDAHGHTGRSEFTLSEGEEKVLDLELSEPPEGH